MTMARLSGICAAVVLSASAALANNERTKTSMDVQFMVDGTLLFIDLDAEVTDSANTTSFVMPDLAAGTKVWNACFETNSDDKAYVTVSYSNDGTEWAVIQYSSWKSSTGYPQKAEVLSQAWDIEIDYSSGQNTLSFEGGQ